MGLESRKSFVFYRSFADAIGKLSSSKMKLLLYQAIINYALNMEEPSFEGCSKANILEALWLTIKPQLDANHRKYKNGLQGAEFGVLGGAPKGNTNAKKTTPKQPLMEMNNVNEEINNDNEKENDNATFKSPTLQEISSYISSINSKVDAEKFFYHYSMTGWKDKNGNPIEGWKAQVHLWDKYERQNNQPRNERPSKNILEMYD